jgi:hypothetical protein
MLCPVVKHTIDLRLGTLNRKRVKRRTRRKALVHDSFKLGVKYTIALAKLSFVVDETVTIVNGNTFACRYS